MKPGKTGIARIIDAAGYSMQGLKAAYQHEAAFRQELLLLAILMPCAIYLAQSTTDAAVLIGSLFMVLITEILNSAIEAIVDLASPDQHELAGRAKDMGSAAVFLAMLNVAITWLFVLLF